MYIYLTAKESFMSMYNKYNFLSEQLMPPAGEYDPIWINWVGNNWGGTLPDGSKVDVRYLLKGLSRWGEAIGVDGSSIYDTSNVSGSVNRNKKSSMTTTNEETQMNFKDYLRQGLNEQSGGQQGYDLAIAYLTWLLSQGLITQEQYLAYMDAFASDPMGTWNEILGEYGQHYRKFSSPGSMDWEYRKKQVLGDRISGLDEARTSRKTGHTLWHGPGAPPSSDASDRYIAVGPSTPINDNPVQHGGHEWPQNFVNPKPGKVYDQKLDRWKEYQRAIQMGFGRFKEAYESGRSQALSEQVSWDGMPAGVGEGEPNPENPLKWLGRTLSNTWARYWDDDAGHVLPNGTVVFPNGNVVRPDGTTVFPDGTVVYPDGTVVYPDGTVIFPDGTPPAENPEPDIPDGDDDYPDPGQEDDDDYPDGGWEDDDDYPGGPPPPPIG